MEKKLRSGCYQKETKSTGMTSSDFVLQQGRRKRLLCKKVKNMKNDNNDSIDSVAIQKKSVQIDWQVVRSDLNNQRITTNNVNSNDYLKLQQRATCSSHRILRCIFSLFSFLKNLFGM